MNIDIQAHDFTLTDSLIDEVEKRIISTLSRRHNEIKCISVRLGDINGPRGGDDKYCRIRVELAGQGDVVVRDIKSDMYIAISRAAERVSRTVSRRVKRLREHALKHRHRNTDLLLTAESY